MLVVTVSSQRSGTKLLAQCFKSGTVVTPFGEVFNPDVPQLGSFFHFMEARGRALIPQGNDALLQAYFGEFEYIHNIVSVDLMFNQVEIPTVTWNPYGHAGIYGFLRAIGAVVISLERDPLDCYVSMEYLKLAPGYAHIFTKDHSLPQVTCEHLLDGSDFSAFAATLKRRRQHLKDAMAGYANFYVLPYDHLSAEQSIPDDLRNLICRAAAQQDIPLTADRIQIYEPEIYKSGINYSEFFANYHELRSQSASSAARSNGGSSASRRALAKAGRSKGRLSKPTKIHVRTAKNQRKAAAPRLKPSDR